MALSNEHPRTQSVLSPWALAGLLGASLAFACGPADGGQGGNSATASHEGHDEAGHDDHAHNGGEKDADGVERLDTGFDLSKLQVTEDDGHGHDHSSGAAKPGSSDATIGFGSGSNQRDFGGVNQGAVLEHTFRFQNDGPEDLVIYEAKPSCGCTVAELVTVGEEGERSIYDFATETPVPPGTKMELTARLNTASKRGRVNSVITLRTSSKHGTTSLNLVAEVKPFLILDPSHIQFGRVSSSDKLEDVITITSPLADTFGLEIDQALRHNQEELDLELKPIDPDADGRAGKWELRVTLGPGIPEAPSRNYPIRLVTDEPMEHTPAETAGAAPQMHQITAYVMAQVTGVVSATPHFISFGLLRPGQPVKRSLTVECVDEGWEFGDLPIGVRGLRGEFQFADLFSWTVTPVEGQNAVTIEVTLDGLPEDFNGSISGILDLGIGHPTKENLEVRFTGVCRSLTPEQQEVLDGTSSAGSKPEHR